MTPGYGNEAHSPAGSETLAEVIKASRVQVDHHGPRRGGQVSDPRARVEFSKEGGRIHAIHVRCRCGEEVIIDCEYDDQEAIRHDGHDD